MTASGISPPRRRPRLAYTEGMKAIKDSLSGRVVLVTGAGSGIGKNAAKMLGYAGAKVAVLSHTKDEVDATVKELTSNGHEALGLPIDVTDAEAMEKAMASIKRTWGRLDFVVANAGINGVAAPIEELKVEDFVHTLRNNLLGTFITIKYAVPLLKVQGGAVVITASVNGNRIFANAGTIAYSCSKAAQVTMAKMLAVELAPNKIRVNAICPGSIATKISDNSEHRHVEKAEWPVEFPKGDIPLTGETPGSSGEVAELIWFLLSDYSDHISGTEVYIDGAQSLVQ
jgi:NAD(P)-dependent dehydrogenase (short-subunit alcohol dehydrogenase family)